MDAVKEILSDVRRHDDELHFDLFYPDADENSIRKFVIGLIDVRAADDIRVSYDKERDGWKIEQAAIFEWRGDDENCDPHWKEVAFIGAWGSKSEMWCAKCRVARVGKYCVKCGCILNTHPNATK